MQHTHKHGVPSFESVFTFGEPILLRVIPQSNSKLGIYQQSYVEITIHPSASLYHPIQTKRLPSKEKEGGLLDGGSKIGKNLLRDCHASTVACLSQLLESIRTLSIQLIKLSTQTSHEPVLKALHQRTIDPSLKALDQSINRIDLPIAYRQLFEATQTIKKHVSSFRKDFRAKVDSKSKGFPCFSRIINSLSQ